MNAQEKWKNRYRSFVSANRVRGTIKIIYFETPSIVRGEMRNVRREAALERALEAERRKSERLQREVEMLHHECVEMLHDF